LVASLKVIVKGVGINFRSLYLSQDWEIDGSMDFLWRRKILPKGTRDSGLQT